MKNKLSPFLFIVILILFIVAFAVSRYYSIDNKPFPQRKSQASNLLSMNEAVVSTDSNYIEDDSTAIFYITTGARNVGLYTLAEDSSNNVIQFLSGEPVYSTTSPIQYRGTDIPSEETRKLIPDDPAHLSLTARLDDREAQYLQLAQISVNATHYYFRQIRCNDVPVYGSYINLHVGEDTEVYSISGALLKTDSECIAQISEEQAHEIALDTLKRDVQGAGSYNVRASEQSIINLNLIGESEDNTNYFTQMITTCADEDICRIYFVDLVSGTVVYDFQSSSGAVDRRVTSDGGVSRTEGQGPVSDQEINEAYDILGDIFNYFNTTHGRDGLDGSGGQVWTYIKQCYEPNASWNGQRISVCSGLVANDVVAHEYQHGVTEYSVQRGIGLQGGNESGALDEGLSDITGYALDSGDWTMGETTTIGAIRDMSNPPSKGHPDRMYSARYYCGAEDDGGVHVNNGVVAKAFYLMVVGGTFPDASANIGQCQINPVGKDKALLIFYRALVTYLKSKTAANYADMYEAANQACSDLYGATSSECINTKSAMQAVQMDMQEKGRIQGPKCWGKAEQRVTCDGSTPPSGQPSPTGFTQPTPTGVRPTAIPSLTLTPTPLPFKKTTKLKSIVSAPTFTNSEVTTEYDGSLFKLTSKLNFSLMTLNINEPIGDAVEIPIHGELLGPNVVNTGRFVIDEAGNITNRFSTSKDLRNYYAYQVVVEAEVTDVGADLPILLADLSPENPELPIDSELVWLDITVRMQGISQKPRFADAILVRVGITGGSLADTKYLYVPFISDNQGLWRGRAALDIPEDDSYCLLIKPQRHTQRKFCDNNPQESSPGEYKPEEENIFLKKGMNTLDFRNVTQLAGDLPMPKQDGVVNSRDILRVRRSLNSVYIEDLAIADLNNDGVVNGSDDAQVVYTLGIRTDE
ncbi:hypothetical protein A3G65_00320 [Candidatus Roizmanbacteria bacterium RIFCSPLOWO2_12_FULL_37_7b]|nr:MAG: hypothetical protein A3G65_00320 [Candidatus Roizmanbacteria bacterium RIFCSPLOWO2_12_FULL_37_7b]